ncbi:glycine zipper family protein [Chloroflexota bacterium]
MEVHNDWYESIAKEVNVLKDILYEKDYKKYKLILLLCIAKRVVEFSPKCGQCQLFQQEITTLTKDVDNIVQIDNTIRRKSYFKAINKVIGHLQRQHKLVNEGQYMAIGVAIGTGIGVALGATMDEVGTGIPIGVGIGVAIGTALDAKARKEGRVLCPRKVTATRKNFKILAIILGLLVLAGVIAFLLIRQIG